MVFIPVTSDVDVLALEQRLLDKFIDTGLLYNRARNALAPGMGMEDSLETRAKKSASKKGIPQDAELIEKRAAANRGQKRSAETCERIGAAKRGNTFWVGKTHSEETKQLLSVVRSKPVEVEGVAYPSISTAAQAHGLSVSTAQKRVASPAPHWNNWSYRET